MLNIYQIGQSSTWEMGKQNKKDAGPVWPS